MLVSGTSGVVLVLAFAVLVLFIQRIRRFIVSEMAYYKELFAEESLREFHTSLSRAIEAELCRDPPRTLSDTAEDMPQFVTRAGLVVVVSCDRVDDGNLMMHLSMSQRGRRTTSAGCSRFGFFALAMFSKTKMNVIPYFTRTGVRHLVVFFGVPSVQLEDFDSTFLEYRSNYQPIPFRFDQKLSDNVTTMLAARSRGMAAARLSEI